MERLLLLDDDDALLLVDDLLDFSCSDVVGGLSDDGVVDGKPIRGGGKENGIGSVVDSPATCGGLQEEALLSPPDELAELDWLSSFVEESPDPPYTSTSDFLQRCFKSSSIYKEQEAAGEAFTDRAPTWLHVSGFPQSLEIGGGAAGSSSAIEETCPSFCDHTWTVPKAGRSRSKRARTGRRIWSFHTLWPIHKRVHGRRPALHDNDWDEEASSLDYEAPLVSRASVKLKKQRKKAPIQCSSSALLTSEDHQQHGRCCSHCQVTRTPQWRAGPMGPKSLCNACGVRYKSGRLVAEYRPAASPTFSTHLHSNSHKKIMEMRLLKSPMAHPHPSRENGLHPYQPQHDQGELSSQESTTCVHSV